MAESRRRRVKSDGDSEGSFSESDVEAEDVNDVENSFKGTPEKISRKHRRRVKSIDGLEEQSVSETESEQEDDVNLIKNEQNTVIKVADGSEYESAEEDKDKAIAKPCEESQSKDQEESLSELVDEEGGEEGIAETEDVEGEDFLTEDHADEEDDGSEEGEYVEEERQQGDGEECSPVNAVVEKELDFDEDRRNPQYIPKKGIFYEHDDRNNNEDVKEKEEEPTRDRKKKLWLDEGRWGHDRFRLEEQFPKTKHELIDTYGYDIRNEDGPPRARRRRRYGRGPTKYERNWEDVTAYGREKFRGSQRGFSRGRGASGPFRGAPRFRGGGRREYDPQDSDLKENEVENGEEEPANNENKGSEIIDTVLPIINNNEFPALPSKESKPEPETIIEKRPFFQKSSSEAPENKSVRTLTFENSNFSGRNSLERDVPSRRGKTAPFGNHERDNRIPERDNRNPEHHNRISEQDNKIPERDNRINERDNRIPERDNRINERDNRIPERDNRIPERDNRIPERDNRFPERDNRFSERGNRFPERGNRFPERGNRFPERGNRFPERDSRFSERDNRFSERDNRRPVPRGPRGSGRGEYNRRGRGNMRHISPRFLENKMNNLKTDMENLAIENSNDVGNGVNSDIVQQLENNGIVSNIASESELPNMALKGAGDSAGRPKRYSSLRQRSLPETNSYQTTQQPVPTQHAPYYETGFQPTLYAATETGVPTPSTQSQTATSPPLINPTAYQTFAPTPYTDSYGLRLPVTTPPPRLFPQATVPGGQPILAPPPPPPCIPANANIINFAPPPPPTGYHQFAYQQYAQPPPPPPPAPPNEIYQTGITYYYPQTQAPTIRPTVQKRPKAAIPILPPPERENKRNEIKEASQLSNNTSRISSIEVVNGEESSLRTESSSQPLPSVGVES